MRIPRLGNNSRLTAVIPDLAGGVDHSRAPWLIADNALSDSENMCWKDGALRTRNGFYTSIGGQCGVDGQTRRFFTDRDGWVVSAEIMHGETVTYLTLHAVSNDGLNARRVFNQELPLGADVCCVPAGGELGDYTTLLFISTGHMAAATPSRLEGRLLEDGPYVPLLQIDGKPVATMAQTEPNGTRYEQGNRLTGTFRCHFTTD